MKHLRYWLWLAVKLCLAALIVVGFWTVSGWVVPPPATGLLAHSAQLGGSLGYTVAVMLAVLLGFLLGWLCAADQVYRCRVCARRLRMPVSQGNYSRVLREGVPHTEYICTFGHGTLHVPDIHISTSRAMHWIGYGSLWEDLMQAEQHSSTPPEP